jgi:hypothetical protein
MNYVIPFAAPSYNWVDFAKLYKMFDKQSPTRTMEQTGLSLNHPNALVHVFGDMGRDWAPSQIFLSYLFLIPTIMVVEFEDLLHMVRFHRLIQGESGGDLLLGGATLHDWCWAATSLDKHPINLYNIVHSQLAAFLRKYEI